jgi:hypothetical protein
MTEAEWLACTNPLPMLQFLRGKTSDRKLRLFACACARQLWHVLAREEWRRPPDDRSRRAVELAEAFVEGRASEEELRAAEGPAQAASNDAFWAAPYPAVEDHFPVMVAAAYAEAAVAAAVADTLADSDVLPELDLTRNTTGTEAAIVRCIFNPFRAVTIDPAWMAWNGGTIPKLAQAIYDERRFADLPVLADALEEAGCDNADLLAHCRQPGEHVRGCWVVDLLLGKE